MTNYIKFTNNTEFV